MVLRKVFFRAATGFELHVVNLDIEGVLGWWEGPV